MPTNNKITPTKLKQEQTELFVNPNKLIYYTTNKAKEEETIYKYKFLFNNNLLQKKDTKPLNKVATKDITEDVIDKEGNIKKKKTGETETSNTIPLLANSLTSEFAKEFYKQEMKKIGEPLQLIEEYDAERDYLEVYNGRINLFSKNQYLQHFNNNGKIKPIKGDYPLIKHLLTNMFGECYGAKINFLKFKYQNPFINTGFCFVLYGNNQIGKSSFIESLLANIFGAENIAPVEKIAKGEDFKFNSGWLSKLVTCFEEFRACDNEAIDILKALIKAKKYNQEGKGSNKEQVLHFNTYYINTNNYPIFLEEQKHSKRFIVLDLAKFNGDNNPLYKIDSTESDFIDEIPYFIHDLMNGECNRPQYKDFDKINTLNKYTSNNIDIWIKIFTELVKNTNIDYIPHETGCYIPLTKKNNNNNLNLIIKEYNDELGNNQFNSINLNKKQLTQKIKDLKNENIRASFNGDLKKRIKGIILNDYIYLNESLIAKNEEE